MLSSTPREQVRRLLEAFGQGHGSIGDVEEAWPNTPGDPLLGSIRFWLWTLFDDDADMGAPLKLNEEQHRLVRNCIRFIDSGRTFVPKPRSWSERIRHALTAGVEWRGCELPWHENWPFPAMVETTSD